MAEIRVNATGGLKLFDADDSHYAQIVAGTITSNVDAITLGHDTVTIADNLSLGSDSAILKFGADTEIALTHVADTGLKLTDSGGTPTLQFHDANESIASDGSKVIITSGGTAFNLPTSDGSDGQFIKTDGSGTLSFGTVSSAADDITTGDSAVTIGTSSGDIKLDAAGDILLDADDTDILLQDGGSTFGGFKQVSSGLQISGGTTPSIVIDTSGRVTMSAQPTFMVSQTGSLSVANGHTLFSTNTTERWDVGSNLSGGTFTAPITGKYLLSYNMLYESVSDDSVFEDYIQTSNRSYAMWRNTRAYASNASYVYNAISVIADLDANDTAKVVHGGGSTATVHHSNGNWPWFQGWLLG